MTEVEEKQKLCKVNYQDPQAELGRQLFEESKERRCWRICEPLNELVSGRRMLDRMTGAWTCKPLGGPGLLDKAGNNTLDFNLTKYNMKCQGCQNKPSIN